MAYTTINKGSSYFNTILYTGTGATNNITGVGFKPDFTWIKNRGSGADWHRLLDAVRGATNELYSNSSNAESAQAQSLQTFNTDGFTLGTLAEVNANANTFASWNWLGANTTVSNTSGSITSTVSANTTSGFSIVGYTGTGATATVGHGLGVAPKMIIVKNRSAGAQWNVYHASLGNTLRLYLNLNLEQQAASSAIWNSTSPTSTVFSLGNDNEINSSGQNLIAYCFADVKGFSKFGSYTGNGSTDGTFVYTGFKPAFIIVKLTSAASEPWVLNDNKRNPYNLSNNILLPNSSDAEQSNNGCDILSNGFKFRSTGGATNGSGSSYIYMAFAENPFVSSTQIPTTAR
jgi:hypothetical protein